MTNLNNEKENCTAEAANSIISRLPDLKSHLIFWPLFVIGLSLDLISKKIIFQWLKPYENFSIIDGVLNFIIAQNAGAAFGIASGKKGFLIAISILALIVILALFFFGNIKNRWHCIALGLFAAGICGNLYDRIFNNGLVRDFIDVVYWPGKHWPAFNVADSMLCIAVGIIIILGITQKPDKTPSQQQK